MWRSLGLREPSVPGCRSTARRPSSATTSGRSDRRATPVAVGAAGRSSTQRTGLDADQSSSLVVELIGVSGRRPIVLVVPPRPELDAITARLDAGDKVSAVAADVGVSERTIRNWLHRAGLPLTSSRSRDRRRARLDDAGWLREHHLDQAQSASTIAHRLGVPTAEVRAALDRFDISPPVNPVLTQAALLAGVDRGSTVSEIARRAGVQRKTVRTAMQRHGIENPHADRGRRPALLDDADWLRRAYVDEQRSMPDIADEVGAAPVTVGRALRRHGIERRRGKFVDEAWLRQAYTVDVLPIAEISRRAGVSVNTIRRRRVEFGIDRRPRTTRSDDSSIVRARRNFDRPGGLDPDWLRRRYVDERATMAQIGREAGVSTTTVHRALRFHGVARDQVSFGKVE